MNNTGETKLNWAVINKMRRRYHNKRRNTRIKKKFMSVSKKIQVEERNTHIKEEVIEEVCKYT